MEWRNSKMREATKHIDAAYYCIKEIKDDGANMGSHAGSRELADAMSLLNLSERMAMRGNQALYVWEERNDVRGKIERVDA